MNEKNVVYVGQAGIRKNGEGILYRLLEHNRNPKKDYWTEAIAITTSNDSLGPTEFSYLEHRLCQLAIEANRYDVKNGNVPTPGNPFEEKQSELEDFIDYARVIVGTLGHKVFEPLVARNSDDSINAELELICNRNGSDARAIRTSDGFVVKKGSKIARSFTKSCLEYCLKKREQYKELIDANFVLLEDILFNTSSGAASFVCGSSAIGNIEWKNADGVTLKDLESKTE